LAHGVHQIITHLFAVGDDLFFLHGLYNRQRRRGNQRSAAKGGCVRTGCKGRRNLIRGKHGPHWKSVGQSLGQRHDVRLDVVVLIGKQRACASHPGLDLIEDQQNSLSVAESSQIGKVILRWHLNPALSLDRFYHYRACRIVNGFFYCVNIVERDIGKPGQQGIKSPPDL